jgi:hypothetical protein
VAPQAKYSPVTPTDDSDDGISNEGSSDGGSVLVGDSCLFGTEYDEGCRSGSKVDIFVWRMQRLSEKQCGKAVNYTSHLRMHTLAPLELSAVKIGRAAAIFRHDHNF